MTRAILALVLILFVGLTGAREIVEVNNALAAGAEGPYRPREICLVRDNVNLCKSKVQP
jgi:hypothetical protein